MKPLIIKSHEARGLHEGRIGLLLRKCSDQTPKSYEYVTDMETFPHRQRSKLYTGWAKDCGFPFLLPSEFPYKIVSSRLICHLPKVGLKECPHLIAFIPKLASVTAKRLREITNEEARLLGASHASPHRHGSEGIESDFARDSFAKFHNTHENDCWICGARIEFFGPRAWEDNAFYWFMEVQK